MREVYLIPALCPVYQLHFEDLLSFFCSEDPDRGGVWLGDPELKHSIPACFPTGHLRPAFQGAGAEVINRKRFLRRSAQAPVLSLQEGFVLPALLDLQISNNELS